MKWLSTTLFTITLMLLPVAIVAEHQNLSTWQSRLVIPDFEPEPNRHTPKHFIGTFLPPIIKTNTTLTENDNPIILTSTTYVQSGVILTLDPGTHLYANENAGLLISGHLISKGSLNKPVWFSSNEEHSLNQTWLGVSVVSAGTAILEYTIIADASPAISCLTGSQTAVSTTKITKTVMGAFITSHDCSISDSIIRSRQDGIVVINANPTLLNNVITAKKNVIKKVDSKN